MAAFHLKFNFQPLFQKKNVVSESMLFTKSLTRQSYYIIHKLGDLFYFHDNKLSRITLPKRKMTR